jgi:hypothetical protein
VFGEGPPDAPIMFVGEQPGDREDRCDRPFVGPAGLLLDKATANAGVDRKRACVTNAVKHFKFEPRGKRRLYKRPTPAKSKYADGGCLTKSRQSARGLSLPLGRQLRRVLQDERSLFRSIAARSWMWQTDCGSSPRFTRRLCYACRMRKRDAPAMRAL